MSATNPYAGDTPQIPVEPGGPELSPHPLSYNEAAAETSRLQRELDITNADHIALWLEANTLPDEPMNQCVSWLACRIVEAHEAVFAPIREALDHCEHLAFRIVGNPDAHAFDHDAAQTIVAICRNPPRGKAEQSA